MQSGFPNSNELLSLSGDDEIMGFFGSIARAFGASKHSAISIASNQIDNNFNNARNAMNKGWYKAWKKPAKWMEGAGKNMQDGVKQAMKWMGNNSPNNGEDDTKE